MKKKLDKQYTFKGEVYGPGEADVPEEWPEDVGEEVKAKGRPKRQEEE